MTAARLSPLVVCGLGALVLAAVPGAEVGFRLVMVACAVVVLAPAVVGVLRIIVLVRPGEVRAGFRGTWIEVLGPDAIVIARSSNGRWPMIAIEAHGETRSLVTFPVPLFFGHPASDQRALVATRDRIRAAARP